MNQSFFELIQISLGARACLSRSPSTEDWGKLYEMVKKQSLVGVCFYGVHKLQSQHQEPPKMLYIEWMGMAAMIQQRNEVVNRQCVELQAKFSEDGFRSCILKGQGIAQTYAEPLRALRQSGDIDVWMDADEESALKWVRKYQKNLDFDYKHVHLDVYADTSVEVHYRPSTSRVPWYIIRVERYNKDAVCWDNIIELGGGTVNVPSIEFNLVFILQHIFGHLFADEMTLKQYLDYYFVLKIAHEAGTDVKAAYCKMKKIGMGRFAGAVMWLLREVFGMPKQWMVCEPDVAEGLFLLNRVLSKDKKAVKGGYGSVRWHLSVLWRQQSKNLHLLTHYPLEVIWSPIWLLSHFVWKRIWKQKHKDLFK